MKIALHKNNSLRLSDIKLLKTIFAPCSQIPFKNLKLMFQEWHFLKNLPFPFTIPHTL